METAPGKNDKTYNFDYYFEKSLSDKHKKIFGDEDDDDDDDDEDYSDEEN
jgi:hypothetical protein